MSRIRLILFLSKFMVMVSLLTGHQAFADPPPIEITCHSESASAQSHHPLPSADGGWYRWRADKHLSGRSELVGWFTCPEVLWNIELNERGHWLELLPGEGDSSVPLVHSGYTGDPDGIRPRFDRDLAHIDLDSVGWDHFALTSASYKFGEFIPSVEGPELVTCDPGMAGVEYDGSEDVPCYLLRRVDGQWEIYWSSEPLTFMSANMGSSTPIVADIDADGELEVAVSTWYYVYVLDLATGELESSATFIKPDDNFNGGGRPYGLLGAFNLDKDAQLEIVILADFMPSISVLDFNTQGGLVEAWDWQIETTAMVNEKTNMVTVNAVSDVTGDGIPDLVANVFNGNDDGLWHLYVFEAISGKVLLDLVNHYAEGIWDLDGDGTSEILATTSNGRLIHEDGPAILMSVSGGSRTDLFNSTSESWHWSNLAELPDHVNTNATLSLYHPTVFENWADRTAVVVTERKIAQETSRLSFYALENGSLNEIATVTGPNVVVYGTDENLGAGTIAVQSTYQPMAAGEIELTGVSLDNSGARDLRRGDGHKSMFRSLLTGTIVLPRDDASPLIISEGSGDNIKAFEIAGQSGAPGLKWRQPGHGMSSGSSGVSKNGLASVLGFKPDASGDYHVAVVRKGPDSGAAIAAIRADGSTRWISSLETQSEPPLWNYPGVTHWMAGHFNAPDREDLYVVIRRSTMHDDTGFMLDGRTGEILWSRRHGAWYNRCQWGGPDSWHQGGANAFQATASDWDGDGLDDVFDHTNSTLAVYRGKDGEVLINRWSAGWCGDDPALLFDPTLFSNQVVGSMVDPGRAADRRILFSMNSVTLASMQFDGTVDWKTPDGSGFGGESLAVTADLDGDGSLEVVTVDHCGTPGSEIRAWDLSDGKLRWTLGDSGMCRSSGAHSPVAADLDGDGRDEIIAVSGSRLIAFAEDASGAGMLRWEVIIDDDPDSWRQDLGTPVIADVTGTGNPAVLINTSSGHLFALGTTADSPLPPIEINAGHSGAWYNPATSGQGGFIDIDPVSSFMFLSWFTFTPGDADHPDETHWFTAQGNYDGNVAELNVYETTGGMFNDPKAVNTVLVGTAIVEFYGCESGQMKYDLEAWDMQGKFPIQRAIPGAGNVCEQLMGSSTQAVDINTGMDGSWYNPETAGQGFFLDAHEPSEGDGFLFLSWFTFGDELASGLRWLTAQGSYSGATANLEVFETTGGRFDDAQEVNTVKIGTAAVTFSDCSNAQVVYNLPDEGKQGEIDVTRALPGSSGLCEDATTAR